MAATIEVRGVRKSFGPTLALDGMSFTVRPGQVTGSPVPRPAHRPAISRPPFPAGMARGGGVLPRS
jgi:ABC-2 type transport system ATP-binding protein